MLDFKALLYDPVYTVLGVPAVLRIWSSGPDLELIAIDKTSGVTIKQAVDVQSVLPGATIRAADLAAAGIELRDVDNATLSLNGRDWRVASLHLSPSPSGELDGEVVLILEDPGNGF